MVKKTDAIRCITMTVCLRRKLMQTIVLLLSLLIMPICVYAAAHTTADGLEIINSDLSEFDFSKEKTEFDGALSYLIFNRNYYSIQSVPKNIELANYGWTSFTVDLIGHDYPAEAALHARIELISGDERLRDALMFVNEINGFIGFRINEALVAETAPGEAQFLITIESEHLIYQEQKTLTVKSFVDDPFFSIPSGVKIIKMKQGETLKEEDFRNRFLGTVIAKKWLDRSTWDQECSWMKGLSPLKSGREDTEWYVTATKEGVAEGKMEIYCLGLKTSLPIRVEVLPYHIDGLNEVKPGQEYQYKIKGTGERHFIWSLTGEGAEIDPESGLLKAKASDGTTKECIITATPDNGDPATMFNLRIAGAPYAGGPILVSGNADITEFDFSGKEELTSLCYGSDTEIFGETLYANDDLPDGITCTGSTGRLVILAKDYEDAQAGSDKGYPAKYAVEFISGEERLKNAISIDESEYQGLPEYYIHLNYEDMPVPGEAVFRITLENDRYWYQQKKTLRVISYSDDPPFFVPDVPVVLKAEKGTEFYFITRSGGLIKSAVTPLMTGGDVSRISMNMSYSSEENALKEFPGIRFEQNTHKYIVDKAGIYDIDLKLRYVNLAFSMTCRLCVANYSITGPSRLKPGETGKYGVAGGKSDFTWSLEGKGASIDTETGVVTVDTDTDFGNMMIITATPKDGGTAVSMNLLIAGFGFDEATEKTEEKDGFTYPVLTGNGWKKQQQKGELLYSSSISDGNGLINQEDVYLQTSKLFVHDDASAIDYYEDNIIEGDEIQSRSIRIDDALAYLYTSKITDNKGWNVYQGKINYVRNNQSLTIKYIAGRKDGPIDDVQPITLDWLEEKASQIHYKEPTDTPKQKDAQLTLSIESDEVPLLRPGKSIQLVAFFANPERVNAERKNNDILWTVTDESTGAETAAATISEDGLLTVAKKLDETLKLRVTATTVYFQTTATLDVNVYPLVKKIETDPKELILYAGSDKTETVRPLLMPESVPAVGLLWEIKKEGIADLIPCEDGTVQFRALAAGKTTVTVTEPSGKKATMNVNVMTPVEKVELKVSGKQTPGGTVTVKEALFPKDAGNRAVEWSLDVNEDIATINSKGQLKISKTTPVGTKITVICKALGASDPVISKTEVTVTEK